jgi:hypothetical protein
MTIRQYTQFMKVTRRRKGASGGDRRVPRTYRLTLAKISAAKRALGAATATETIERALDLVVFQRQLVDGTRSMLGVRIASPDPEP